MFNEMNGLITTIIPASRRINICRCDHDMFSFTTWKNYDSNNFLNFQVILISSFLGRDIHNLCMRAFVIQLIIT